MYSILMALSAVFQFFSLILDKNYRHFRFEKCIKVTFGALGGTPTQWTGDLSLREDL